MSPLRPRTPFPPRLRTRSQGAPGGRPARSRLLVPAAAGFLAAALLAGAALAFGLIPLPRPLTGETDPVASPALPPEALPPAPAGPTVVREGRVREGDTLITLLTEGGVPEALGAEAGRLRAGDLPLSRVVAGKPFRFLAREGRLVEWQYEPDDARLVRLFLDGPAPRAELADIPLTRILIAVKGTVTDSLFAAVEEAGEEDELAMELADVFAWQVDFFRDIRRGDSFSVLVERVFREGRPVGYGAILAAEYVSGDRRHQAFLWTDAEGRREHFDELGQSVRKEFLKAPLHFRRISSGFSRQRLHPVTRRVKAHLGTDYAAPSGTPVVAIGDGRVTGISFDSANGRLVRLRHNGTYASAYGHLSAYARGLRVGKEVRQGEVIGYVGSSGLSTGPHLHFVLTRNRAPVDSRRVETPRASALPEGDRQAFNALVMERLALLSSGATVIAQAPP